MSDTDLAYARPHMKRACSVYYQYRHRVWSYIAVADATTDILAPRLCIADTDTAFGPAQACDWDACEQCYTLWEAKRKSVFGVSARSVSGCPGQHALAQSAGAEGWNCDVCKRNLASGERAYGCRVCNWDACQPCAFGCKAGHELSVQTVGVDEMFCDVCARGLARGEMTMGCRACDWDACGACFQGWRDAAPMPREVRVLACCVCVEAALKCVEALLKR